jgi:hypothetical protein
MFIPDPDLDFLPIPDPGSRDQQGTGSESATLTNSLIVGPHFYLVRIWIFVSGQAVLQIRIVFMLI